MIEIAVFWIQQAPQNLMSYRLGPQHSAKGVKPFRGVVQWEGLTHEGGHFLKGDHRTLVSSLSYFLPQWDKLVEWSSETVNQKNPFLLINWLTNYLLQQQKANVWVIPRFPNEGFFYVLENLSWVKFTYTLRNSLFYYVVNCSYSCLSVANIKANRIMFLPVILHGLFLLYKLAWRISLLKNFIGMALI